MARISTYAVSSPAELTDELVGSDINKATKNFTVQSILDLTGVPVGTENTLSMFGPGTTLIDSLVSQDNIGIVYIGTQASGTRFTNTSISTPNLLGTDLYVANIYGQNGGLLSIQGNAIIGNEATDTLVVNSVSTFNAGVTIANELAVPKVNFGFNAYYGRDMFISGIDEGSFDGVQVTNEFVIGKLANTTGDLAMYFKYGDERVGGIYLDDDASQQGLSFYVQESAANANIVKKISLREGTTIGSALATTLPPANGLAVQGDVRALGNTTLGEDDSTEVTIESTLSLQGPIKDSGSNLGSDQQVLVSNASGGVSWGAYTTGTVKGTGTVNSVPKWSATDTLQDSIIFDNGTNVAIGTTNPADKLHVQGTVRAVVSGSSGIAFNAINGFGVSSAFRFDNNHAVLALRNNSNVIATKISSDGFSWFDGGSVGFGTKTPAAPIEMVINSSTDGLLLSNVGDNSAYDSIGVTYSGYGTGSPECVFRPKTQPGSGIVNTYFRFQTNGGELTGNKANVTVDGKVGIGTTNDVIASRLTVAKGDIEVTEYQKGLILRSTNGTRYRLVVADDGTLTTTAV